MGKLNMPKKNNRKAPYKKKSYKKMVIVMGKRFGKTHGI